MHAMWLGQLVECSKETLMVPQGCMVSPTMGPTVLARDLMVGQKDIMINTGTHQAILISQILHKRIARIMIHLE